MRPLLLDLFCGAGGAAMGYSRAGFRILGVDINPQPHYPFDFMQADALDWLDHNRNAWDIGDLSLVRAIHASPPCQAHLKGLRGVNKKLGRVDGHRDFIGEIRDRLREMDCFRYQIPYVIENVVGAPLIDPVRLCGSAFGLPIRRHRHFESNVQLVGLPCEHHREGEKKYWTSFRGKSKKVRRSSVVQVYGAGAETHEWGPALGIDWMTPRELTQAIPPAYTEHIGRQLIQHVQKAVA